MENKKESFLGGLFLGGMMGAIFAFLFTPFTGKEAREKIKSKVDEIKQQPPFDAIEDIKENTQEVISTTICSIEEGISKLQSAVEEAKKASDEKRKELNENKS